MHVKKMAHKWPITLYFVGFEIVALISDSAAILSAILGFHYENRVSI